MFDRCRFSETPPNLSDGNRNLCLIYDQALNTNSSFLQWKQSFDCTYAVEAGESLKQLDRFSHHLNLLQESLDHQGPVTFVAAGGGAVGDFVGFLASVYKRGVPLIHVPTTFLSVLDSAHGGKTALNLGTAKNQIGSFYPAQKIYVVKDFLQSLSENHLREACGELVKMAFIEDLKLYFDVMHLGRIDFEDFWRMLPAAIQAKYDVVAKDPKEESGYRQILNLGHTLGHLIEADLGWSHGKSVAYGLSFSLGWSRKKGFLNREKYKEKIKILETQTDIKTFQVEKLDYSKFLQNLKKDKKYSKDKHFHFIFIRSSGEVFRELVHEDEFIKEATRQGWL